jgi:hypothetical protein
MIKDLSKAQSFDLRFVAFALGDRWSLPPLAIFKSAYELDTLHRDQMTSKLCNGHDSRNFFELLLLSQFFSSLIVFVVTRISHLSLLRCSSSSIVSCYHTSYVQNKFPMGGVISNKF